MSGERGPKGDHGQHGDPGPGGLVGPEGREGVQGITGERGKVGDTGKEGKRGLRGPAFAGPVAWVILVVVITTVLVAQGCQIQANRDRLKENQQANQALCALRHDLEVRIAATTKLLNENEGDIFGIPRELIVSGRDNQRQTIKSLSDLDCPPERM